MNTLKHIRIALALFFIWGAFSCNDFLQHDPYGPGNSGNFWKTEDDVKQALNAFASRYAYWEGTGGRGIMWFENCSDNMVTGRTHGQADAVKNFNMSSASTLDVRQVFPRMYQLIAMSNEVLLNIPNITLPEDLKNNAYGQAHFYRAFAYLWLCPYYADNGPNGGLPIRTEDPEWNEKNMTRPASVLENYDMIISDMLKAGERLPLHSQLDEVDYGKPHKAAAWALGARAALYAAQYDKKYFDVVLDFTNKVMSLTGKDQRALFDDGSADPFSKLFTKEQNFCPEYLFSILGNEIEGPKYHGMSFQNGGFGYYNTWGYYQPTKELYDAFEPGDVRREATILSPGEEITFIGKKIVWAINPPSISSPTAMTFRKFMSIFEAEDCIGKDVSPNGNNQSNRLGQTLIRYADVLLMRAEALIWKNGEGDQEAKQLLNQIRKRARLPEDSQATKEELKNQRRCELAFEFMPSRHLDLVRWGDAATVYARPLHGFKVTTDGSTITSKEAIEVWPARTFNPKKHHVFPIPANDIANSEGLVQNQGY